MKNVFTSLFVAASLLSAPAIAREKYGVKMPDTTTVNGQQLELQGMGLREKWFVDVYVAGLYLANPEQGPLADQTKQMKIVVLRDLSAQQVGEAIREGFQANPQADLAALQPRLDKLTNALQDVKKGESIVLTYSPEKAATLVTSGGQNLVTIEGKDFANALFAVWLGERPIDADLKRELLGQS